MKSFMPDSLPELAEALGNLTSRGKIIAGGTDLVIALNRGLSAPDALLYLGKVESIQGITETPDGLEIGAMATMAALAGSDLLAGPYAALRHAAAEVGSPQIRSAATIGGNIANASPGSDLAPVLVLLDAEAVIAGASGIRRAPVAKILTGPGTTSLAYHEAILCFVLPKPKATQSAFVKLGYRKALAIARIGLAMLLDFSPDGAIAFVKIVAGAIAPVPVRVQTAEQHLMGKKPDEGSVREVGKLLSALILETCSEAFDRDYKARAAMGITEDLFKKIAIQKG